jgi:hypothetical protein
MPFSSYTSVQAVARAFQIICSNGDFVQPLPMQVSAQLRADLEFARKRIGFLESEFAICENLIFPILREVWKSAFLDDLQLWSHVALDYDADLSGVPDYLVARRSPLGDLIREEPYLLVSEAKKDDFVGGWGRCLAAMLAAQKIGDRTSQTVLGIVTNGAVWTFGKLEGNRFMQDLRSLTLSQLDQLCAAVNFLFDQCRQQLQSLAPLSP